MADERKSLLFDIEVQLDQLKSLNEQLKTLRKEMDAIVQLRHQGKITEITYEEKALQFREREKELLKQINELESHYATVRDKNLQKEAEIRHKLKQETQTLLQKQQNLNQLMSQYAALRNQSFAALKSGDWSKYVDLQAQMNALGVSGDNFISYQQRLALLQSTAMKLHQEFKAGKVSVDNYKKSMAELSEQAKKAHSASVEFFKDFGIHGRGFYSLSQTIDYFLAKTRSHIAWILSGTVISGLMTLPDIMTDYAKQIEIVSQKIKQNLELSAQYVENRHQLNEDIKHLQEVAGIYAVGYGADYKEVMNAMNIISRRFKDTNAINYITSLALTLHKLDFVPITKAASDLEAVILQFGLNANQAKDFVNQFSYAVHSARITGVELLDALQRSGSVFRQYGADTKTAIAVVSSLATTTARTGAVIGNAWKSILASTQKDKILEAFDQLGISMYKANGEAKEFDVLFGEIMQKWASFDQETRNKFGREWAGIYQLNQLSAFLNDAYPVYKEIMEGLEKANDALTGELLATGLNTYQQRLDQLTASFQVFSTTIGYEIMPVMKELVIGLTQGINYLNENRETISKLISTIGILGEALLLYRGYQLLTNVVVSEGTLALRAMYLLEGNFTTAFANMGASIMAFARTVSLAAGRLLFFLAIAEVVNHMIATYKESKDISSANQYFRSKGQTTIGGKTDLELLVERRDAIDQELSQINAKGYFDLSTEDIERIKQLQAEREELTAKIQEKIHEAEMGKMVDKFKNIERDALNKMQDKDLAAGSGGIGTINIPDLGKRDRGGSSGSSSMPVTSERIKRDLLQRDQNKLFLEAKLAADEYAKSINDLNTKEELRGKSLNTTIERINLMRGRMSELNNEQQKYNEKIGELEKKLDNAVTQDEEFKKMLSIDKVDWNLLTKDEKWQYIQTNREFLQNHETINKIIQLIERYRSKASEASKETNELKNNFDKLIYGDSLNPEKIYKRALQDNEIMQRILLARATNKYDPNNEVELNRIRLNKLYMDRDEHNKRLKDLEKQKLEAEEAMNKETTEEMKKFYTEQYEQAKRAYDTQLAILEETNSKIRQMEKEKNEHIRSGFAGIVEDVLINGNSLKDIWKRLWADLAREAIYRLFQVQTQASLLGSIFNIFGVKSAPKADAWTLPNGQRLDPNFGIKWHNGGIIPRYHSGAVIGTSVVPYLKSDESLAILQSGEEVNSRKDRRTTEIMAEQNKAILATLAEVSKSSQPVNITIVTPDTGSFAEYLKQHGDVLVNILREQRGLNNVAY